MKSCSLSVLSGDDVDLIFLAVLHFRDNYSISSLLFLALLRWPDLANMPLTIYFGGMSAVKSQFSAFCQVMNTFHCSMPVRSYRPYRRSWPVIIKFKSALEHPKLEGGRRIVLHFECALTSTRVLFSFTSCTAIWGFPWQCAHKGHSLRSVCLMFSYSELKMSFFIPYERYTCDNYGICVHYLIIRNFLPSSITNPQIRI
jgi:hypothetical protein